MHALALTPTHKKIHMAIRTILILVTLIAGILFLKELLFPTYVFQYRAAIDSLANTISRPYVTEYGTTSDLAAYGDFTKTTISITLPKDAAPLPDHTRVSVRHGYRAFFAPMSTKKYTDHLMTTYEINGMYYLDRAGTLYPFFSDAVFESYLFTNNTSIPDDSAADFITRIAPKDFIGFASGTLIKSSDGVFVIDGATKHPFQDEASVLALGYHFDNVRTSTNEERALHEKARMFDISSTHPFGTIFYARDADRMYIYDKNELHKIEPHIQSRSSAIVTDELSRTTFDTCTLSRNLLHPRTYTCTIPLVHTAQFSGNIYQFMIDAPQVSIEKSQITLSTAPTHASFVQRVTAIINELRKYYLTTNE